MEVLKEEVEALQAQNQRLVQHLQEERRRAGIEMDSIKTLSVHHVFRRKVVF